jgi:hypothetical protein
MARAPGEPRLERLALEEFHHDEVDVVLASDIVQGADVLVRQRRDGPRLALEAETTARIGHGRRRQDLHRHPPPETRVDGFEDLAHSAGTDAPDDFIRTKPRAGWQGHAGILGCGRA